MNEASPQLMNQLNHGFSDETVRYMSQIIAGKSNHAYGGNNIDQDNQQVRDDDLRNEVSDETHGDESRNGHENVQKKNF